MKPKLTERLPLIYLGVGTALTIVLWLLRPAAGEGLSGVTALFFWALHVAIVLPLLYGAQELLGKLSYLDRLSPISATVVAGILGSVAFTPFAVGLDALFAAPNDSEDTGPIWQLWTSEFGSFVFPISLVWVLLNARALSRLSVPRLLADEEMTTAVDPEISEDEREFWSRMPKPLGKNIVAVSAELHYLRVYTTLGDTLILFGFGRSLEVLQRFDGMQIHRSHWVALPHVADLVRNGGSLRARLSNDIELSVSRANAKALKDRLAGQTEKELAAMT
ncbi:LytTR family DNA-binding domain-containing protein [Cognatiyoonia sp. IB215446]|uniref:LytTR family DNA-binding domain-containing protein n=1 Tax=Cognatiyoonia sp. IB215446 TaxID=3097355 RepID=UPI002A1460FD|nr:LytTR family DNA-binding domain-containing protein [Cognatiyoonia sp. IB215446]MDX8350648.1 LytTR family DNA-binding domain-containing protein [Cognatiyoonia sp. IB215446]